MSRWLKERENMETSSWEYLKAKLIMRKTILIGLIAITSFLPLTFLDLNEPTSTLVIYKLLAKAGSLCGTVLILWQFLLGFRAAMGKIMRDYLWVLETHKQIGKYILLLISLHPIFITLYYLEKKNINLFLLEGTAFFKWWVLGGMLAFALFIAVVLTSVFLREYLGRVKWYSVHILSYAAFALALGHAFALGSTIGTTGAYYFWLGLSIIAAAFLLYRLICRAELLSAKHVVTKVENVGNNVTRISCEPAGRKLKAQLGQFIFFRRGLKGRIRPFTVSHYQPQTGEMSITVKALGETTQNLQSIKPGETVYIDGPYGVFSHAAMKTQRSIVMIAGGIGITPFLRLFEELAYQPGRELHLFYGNKKKHEILYKQELENVETVNVIHVLSDQPEYQGETGYITIDLLRKYLHRPLNEYEFLICGPPVMITKLESDLSAQDVPQERIHHELFGY
jgi:predicted ferric reductase